MNLAADPYSFDVGKGRSSTDVDLAHAILRTELYEQPQEEQHRTAEPWSCPAAHGDLRTRT